MSNFRQLEHYFIDSQGNKRKKVIELHIDKIDKDENIVTIAFQNEIILTRGDFYDEEIGVASVYSDFGVAYEKAILSYCDENRKTIFAVGDDIETDKKIFFIIGYNSEDLESNEVENYLEINDKELQEIVEKVRLINEKYGILCRVPKNQVYY